MDPVTLSNGKKENFNVLLKQWNEMALNLKVLKEKEIDLRKKLSSHFFANPKEGTTTVPLGNDWKLKNVHKINRTCDEASFKAVFAELPEGAKDRLIKYTPEIVIAEYRKLSDDDRNILDQALSIKPGSPTLSLVSPKVKS